jgi:hypothetical protein
MSKYQTSIIWLGLILIALNVIVNLSEFKSVLFNGPSTTSSTTQKSSSSVTV